jgi:hypothetical protein
VDPGRRHYARVRMVNEHEHHEHDDCLNPAGPSGAQPGAISVGSAGGIHRFRTTATGTVLAAGLLGLATALEGPKDEEVAIVTDYSGEPPFSDPIVLRLDPDAPGDSIVWVRRVDPSGS